MLLLSPSVGSFVLLSGVKNHQPDRAVFRRCTMSLLGKGASHASHASAQSSRVRSSLVFSFFFFFSLVYRNVEMLHRAGRVSMGTPGRSVAERYSRWRGAVGAPCKGNTLAATHTKAHPVTTVHSGTTALALTERDVTLRQMEELFPFFWLLVVVALPGQTRCGLASYCRQRWSTAQRYVGVIRRRHFTDWQTSD